MLFPGDLQAEGTKFIKQLKAGRGKCFRSSGCFLRFCRFLRHLILIGDLNQYLGIRIFQGADISHPDHLVVSNLQITLQLVHQTPQQVSFKGSQNPIGLICICPDLR